MIVVFGSINLDLVAQVPQLPAPGETVAGTAFATVPGGKGANQALAARRAGADVALCGAVGRDDFASAALVNLVAQGVHLDGVARADAPTGVALITVDARGENTVCVIPGANAQARAAQVRGALLTAGNTLLIQLETPLAEVEALAVRARAAGARTVLNAAPWHALPSSLLRALDVLVVNEGEAAACAQALHLPAAPEAFAAAMRRDHAIDTVVTLGGRGALVMADEQVRAIAPPRVAVVDTTGAGDAFCGHLAALLDRGTPLADAVTGAVEAGAQACTWRGAQPPGA